MTNKRIQKKQERIIAEKQKARSENPAYQYINNSDKEFPKQLREDLISENNKVDDKLAKLYIELSIIDEQRHLQQDILRELSQGVITRKTPDGRRVMSEGEMKTQSRICETTIWQSKSNIEQTLQELIQFVGVQVLGTDRVLLTEQEHSDVAMMVIDRAKKQDVLLFASNKASLIEKIKG